MIRETSAGILRPPRRCSPATALGFIVFALGAGGCDGGRDAARSESVAAIRAALEGERDFGKALSLASDAAHADPESVALQYWLGRAYQARGRFGDALRAFETARDLGDDELGDEIRFGIAKTCALRFLGTRDRADLNRVESDLREFSAGGPHAAAASILLGLALSEPSPRRDAKKAFELLEQGFRIEAEPAEIEDRSQARTRLEDLRRELNP